MFENFLAEPFFYLNFIAVLLLAGACAGMLAGLLGVGGGIVIVPVLFLLFPFLDIRESVRMHLAVGTSLATIIPTSIMSARAHYKKGSVDIDLLKSWGIAIFIGVVVGGYLGGNASGEALALIFAVIAVIVALHMLLGKENSCFAARLPGGILKGFLGFIIGAFSVVMGIGGGALSVPVLTGFNFPMRRAVGTASAIGLIIAVPGAISFIIAGLDDVDLPPGSLGYLNVPGFCSIAPATMLTAPLGARIAHAINPAMLRRVFACFLLLASLRMFYSVFEG